MGDEEYLFFSQEECCASWCGVGSETTVTAATISTSTSTVEDLEAKISTATELPPSTTVGESFISQVYTELLYMCHALL